MVKDINVVALVKGKEQYFFLFRDGQRQQVEGVMSTFVANPELSFTQRDADSLSRQMNEDERANRIIDKL